MKRLKMFFKFAIFSTILVVSLLIINHALRPKNYDGNSYWPTASSYSQFYRMKRNTVDVFLIGSSVCVNDFNPQVLYDAYGIRSYNLGSEQQSPFLSYYWLKEALKYQKPSVVVLETKFLFPQHPDDPINTVEGLTHKCLDSMRISDVKIEAVNALCALDQTQSTWGYYLTNIRYHNRWKELSEGDFNYKLVSYENLKGYSPIIGPAVEENEPYVPYDPEARKEMMPLMQEYTDKIVDLCQSRGIKLILVSAPSRSMSDGENNTLQYYAAEHDITYINLGRSDIYQQLGMVYPQDNAFGHANLSGAEKLSMFLGDVLANEYGVMPVRDTQYDATHDYYSKMCHLSEVDNIDDMSQYLRVLADYPELNILITADGAAGAYLSDADLAALNALGLSYDREAYDGSSYLAIIRPDADTIELASPDSTHYEGTLNHYLMNFDITSTPVKSSILIGEEEHSLDGSGFNIVVYDDDFMRVIDAVCFDTTCEDSEDQLAIRRTFH